MTRYLQLVEWFKPLGKVVVAFSGGVDSTLVCRAAHDALADEALAMTAVSPSLAPSELEDARALARRIGIDHRLIESGETKNPAYLANDSSRCFHCRVELYDICCAIAAEVGDAVVVDGLNLDDLGEHRPGRKAAQDAGVRSPFVEVRMGKQEIRAISRDLGLPSADKPEMACLASRFPTGTVITEEALLRVAAAEAVVAAFGFSQYRVRFHGDLARIEVPEDEIALICDQPLRAALLEGVRAAGFRWVSIDLSGYERGGVNAEAMAIEV